MNSMLILSLSSGILLLNFQSLQHDDNPSGAFESTSNNIDPYQRAALLFAMYQTSLEVSHGGLSSLLFGGEALYFKCDRHADSLIVLSTRQDFNHDIARYITMWMSESFSLQGMSTQNSPRASSVRSYRQEVRLFLRSLLLENAAFLTSLLLPSCNVNRNLFVMYKKEDILAKDVLGTKVSAILPAELPSTGEHVDSNNAHTTPHKDRFHESSSPSERTIIPYHWVNAIRSMLGMKRIKQDQDLSVSGADGCSIISDDLSVSPPILIHAHHFTVNQKEEISLNHIEWNTNMPPTHFQFSSFIPKTFSSDTYAEDRVGTEREGFVHFVCNFCECHFAWYYSIDNKSHTGQKSVLEKSSMVSSMCFFFAVIRHPQSPRSLVLCS